MINKKDFYFKKAKEEGFRARSAYKLLQIQKKFKIFKKGDYVLDLGCAPGSWLQAARIYVGNEGYLLGIDLQEVSSLPYQNIETLTYDLTDKRLFEEIKNILKKKKRKKFDVILSDASPNISGIWDLDVFRAMRLARASLSLATKFLNKKGVFVVKLFQGKEYSKFLKELKKTFKVVKLYKPKASRKKSAEIYAICFELRRFSPKKNTFDYPF